MENNLVIRINHFYTIVSNLYTIINTKKGIFINSFKNGYEVK